MARPLVVWVRMRERVRPHLPPGELPHDAPASVPRGSVHQHVAHQEHVDRVRRQAGELPNAVGYLFHERGSVSKRPPGPRLAAGPAPPETCVSR